MKPLSLDEGPKILKHDPGYIRRAQVLPVWLTVEAGVQEVTVSTSYTFILKYLITKLALFVVRILL